MLHCFQKKSTRGIATPKHEIDTIRQRWQDAEERLAKAELTVQLNQLLQEKHLKQVDAAKILGIDQPKISALQHSRLAVFLIERLITFLNKLDQDIEIIVRSRLKRRKSPVRLHVAFG